MSPRQPRLAQTETGPALFYESDQWDEPRFAQRLDVTVPEGAVARLRARSGSASRETATSSSVFPAYSLAIFTRKLEPPDRAFFLLGARGTGKTTWIQKHFAEAPSYDLLLTSESLRLNRDPGLLRAECSALPDGAWIVIDEVQRAPRRTFRCIRKNAARCWIPTGLGVYTGSRALVMDDVRVLPWKAFLAQLWAGEIV